MDIPSTMTTIDNGSDDTSTRQSSKLSLGSSPSVLSADEQLDGDGPLTPTDKIEDDEDDDDLSPLNSILHADSPGSLSNGEVSEDDLHTEQDSASPLSSVPDDFPLSRSVSPEVSEPIENIAEESVHTKGDSQSVKKSVSGEDKSIPKKRRKEIIPKLDENDADISDQEEHTLKKPKQDTVATEDTKSTKRGRASRIDSDIKSRKWQTKQEENNSSKEKVEEVDIKTEDEKIVESESVEKRQSPESECEDQKIMVETTEHDDHDYQQRHKEALEALTHIEMEFARLRDKMYQEKMSELNEEAIMIANGTHPELISLMAEIEEKKDRRISSAEAWRRHQHANFKKQFEGFEYQANIHFISQKNALRRNLLSGIYTKRWRMDDERAKLNDPTRNRIFLDGREMVAHKRGQKEESGELQDIKEAVGFPMAPNPIGLNSEDVDEDLKILGINRNS
ncbi:Sds3-like-domain-containing protein [Pilobolus umbonatus]|nr:Sds3-like-domain-containing protein [Pilobolus umbonatus]